MTTSKVVLKFLSVSINILIYVLILFVLLRLGAASYNFGYRVFTEPPMSGSPGRDVSVQINPDMSAIEIGTAMEEKGLIDNANLFAVQLKVSVYANKVKPGLYTLNTSQTAKEMLAVISAEQTEEEGSEEKESKEE